jgi:catechol 2,3-dioxygenase-like lactoylglutathione lyase family enzyme
MTDLATPNLPARDFDATEVFYTRLGFEPTYRDNGWMILKRGSLVFEFFPHPELDPLTSWFSCCLRLDDLDGFVEAVKAANIPVRQTGNPRLHLPRVEPSGLTIGYLIDLDGSLIRLIQND